MAKKKSSVLLTIVMLAGGMLMGGAFGFLFGMQMNTLSAAWGVDSLLLTLALMLICLYAAIFLQIILHEGGYLLFGLLTGYSFVSFRIGSLMLIRSDGRLRLKKFSLAGTGGQCLMSPPGVLGEAMPFMLYNFGGVLMNLFYHYPDQ